jgi:hypothetical protein
VLVGPSRRIVPGLAGARFASWAHTACATRSSAASCPLTTAPRSFASRRGSIGRLVHLLRLLVRFSRALLRRVRGGAEEGARERALREPEELQWRHEDAIAEAEERSDLGLVRRRLRAWDVQDERTVRSRMEPHPSPSRRTARRIREGRPDLALPGGPEEPLEVLRIRGHQTLNLRPPPRGPRSYPGGDATSPRSSFTVRGEKTAENRGDSVDPGAAAAALACVTGLEDTCARVPDVVGQGKRECFATLAKSLSRLVPVSSPRATSP